MFYYWASLKQASFNSMDFLAHSDRIDESKLFFMLSYVLCLSLFSSVKVFELNLVAIKLVQEEALSRLLWLYQAAPRKSPLFQVLIICTFGIFPSIHFHIIW